MKSFRLLISGIIVATVLTVAGFVLISKTDASDCRSSAVVKCGVSSITDLRNKYNNDTTKGTKVIYGEYGLTSSVINSYNYKEGKVTKNGEVYVGGVIVASGASTADRIDIAGSNRATKHVKDGVTYYSRSTEVTSKGLAEESAIVFFDANGNFAGAVIYDCGNPIKAVPVKPSVVCTSLTPAKITDTKYSFKTVGKVTGGAVIQDYSYDFGDGSTSNHTSASVQHDYAKAGTYKIKASVNAITPSGKVITSANKCEATVTISPKQVKACKISTKEIVTVDESKIDDKTYTLDLSKCKETPPVKVKACKISTKEIVTVDESKIDDKTYTLDLSKCKETPPVKVKVCKIDSKEIIEIDESEKDNSNYTTDLSKCESTPPTTPPELPHTGIGGIGSLVGASSLVGVGLAYLSSRRSL